MASWDLIKHLERQRAWSEKTFGPGLRTKGVSDHICKELHEISQKPEDLMEWVDVILLALDGAWRAGHDSAAIAAAINYKQGRNESRTWPDWRTADPDKAIEHKRTGEAIKHEERVVGHVSGWQERMGTCICGHRSWPCPGLSESE